LGLTCVKPCKEARMVRVPCRYQVPLHLKRLGVMAEGLKVTVQALRFKVQGLGFRV